jgi:hypothetical protein
MVVAIPNEHTRCSLGEFGEHAEFVGIGWGYREAADEPRPAHPNVDPEAVEGLLEEGVFAESGLPLKARAAIGAGKQASWQGHRIADGEGRVVGCKRKELLPEELFDLPEVGRLPGEGGAMNLTECRKPLAVVMPEVAEDSLIGVEPQELADKFDSEDLSV